MIIKLASQKNIKEGEIIWFSLMFHKRIKWTNAVWKEPWDALSGTEHGLKRVYNKN